MITIRSKSKKYAKKTKEHTKHYAISEQPSLIIKKRKRRDKFLTNIIYNLFKKYFFIFTFNNIRFSDHLTLSGIEFQITTPACLIINPDRVVCLISLVN